MVWNRLLFLIIMGVGFGIVSQFQSASTSPSLLNFDRESLASGPIFSASVEVETEEWLLRQELIETLDRIMISEHHYRSVYGYFTRFFNRTGIVIPESLRDKYDIRVSEVSANRLLLTASSEDKGKIIDFVSINESFHLKANFPLPDPRAEYLSMLAERHLRNLMETSVSELREEQTCFKGYFKYDIQKDFSNQKIAVALGIKNPVRSVKLQFHKSQSQIVKDLIGYNPLKELSQAPFPPRELSSESVSGSDLKIEAIQE